MTTVITNDELDAALNELVSEQEDWFKDANERRQQETAKQQAETSMRIAVAIQIGEYLKANENVTYRARASSLSVGLRINPMQACPLHN